MWNLKQEGRFYYRKRQSPFRTILIDLFVFFTAVFLFCQGMNRLSDWAGEEQKKSLEEAVWRGITQCYAIEGRYPESLNYLEREYGLQYDTEQFFIDYQPIGANIVPDVTIVEK